MVLIHWELTEQILFILSIPVNSVVSSGEGE